MRASLPDSDSAVWHRARADCLADKMPVCEPLSKSPRHLLSLRSLCHRLRPQAHLGTCHRLRSSALASQASYGSAIRGRYGRPPADKSALGDIRISTVTGCPARIESPVVERGTTCDQALRHRSGVSSCWPANQAFEPASDVNPLCGKVSGPGSVKLIGNDKICRREP